MNSFQIITMSIKFNIMFNQLVNYSLIIYKGHRNSISTNLDRRRTGSNWDPIIKYIDK